MGLRSTGIDPRRQASAWCEVSDNECVFRAYEVRVYYSKHLSGVQRVFTSCRLAFIELHEASRRASQARLLVERLERECSPRQVCEGGSFKLSYIDSRYNVVSKPERKPGKTLGKTDHAFETRSPSYPGHIVRLPQFSVSFVSMITLTSYNQRASAKYRRDRNSRVCMSLT